MRLVVDCGDVYGRRQRCVCVETGLGETPAAIIAAMVPQAPQGCLYLSLLGARKPLVADCALAESGVTAGSTLALRVRLRGGGGDGGATGAESRDCYLKMYAEKKPDKVDPYEARLAQWSHCRLSADVLKPPCVVDLLGNIYNKESVVSAMLTKSLPKESSHIRNLKDLINIHLSSIPGISPDSDEDGLTKFQCPISGQEFNGKYRFYALRTCGHVLSAKALKEMQTKDCLVCRAPFTEKDKIVINGTEEEVSELWQRLLEEKFKPREKKDKKKVKPEKTNSTQDAISYEEKPGVITTDVDKAVVTLSGSKRKEDKNGLLKASESAMAKSKDLPKKKFKASDHVPSNATPEVYASIFTSSNKSTVRETYMCRSLPIGRN